MLLSLGILHLIQKPHWEVSHRRLQRVAHHPTIFVFYSFSMRCRASWVHLLAAVGWQGIVDSFWRPLYWLLIKFVSFWVGWHLFLSGIRSDNLLFLLSPPQTIINIICDCSLPPQFLHGTAIRRWDQIHLYGSAPHAQENPHPNIVSPSRGHSDHRREAAYGSRIAT